MPDPRLTIVLLLKGRLPFTRRWLAHAKDFLPFPVLVADGSADDEAREAAAVCRELAAAGKPVEYVRYPYDADLGLFYAKIADAVGRVRTPYAVLADNDDFFEAGALKACVDFLDSNPDHVACGGRMVGFTVDGERFGRVYGRKVSFQPQNASYELSAPSAAERVRLQFANYRPTWYDVHRSEVLENAAQTLKAAAPKDIFLMELWTSFLAAAAGPIRHLPRAYLFRQRNTPSSAAADEADKGGYLHRSLAESWKSDSGSLCADIAAAVAERDGIPIERVLPAIRASFEARIAAAISSEEADRPHRRRLAQAKSTLSSNILGRAVLPLLKAMTGAIRRLRASPLSPADRPAARALAAFLTDARRTPRLIS